MGAAMDETVNRLLDEIEQQSDPLARARLVEEALDLVSRENDPGLWAGLQGTLGSSLIKTPAEHWDSALGERIVSAYQAALGAFTAERDPAIWAQTWRNIGATHFCAIMHGAGDEYEQVKAAKVAYEHAMSVPPEGLNPEVVAAWRSEEAAVDQLLARHQRSLRDPFGLAEQAAAQAEAIRRDAQSGIGPLPTKTEARYPALLNEEIAQLRLHLHRVIERGFPEVRTAAQRSALERSRWQMFRLAFEHLTEKYEAAERTRELFARIRRDETGFVLFLRGFAMRGQSRPDMLATAGQGASLEEGLAKQRLVADLAPIAVVWIANPVDSGPLELAMVDGDADQLGYRVEMGEGWEAAVRALVAAATAIVIHNPVITPGVAYEIALVDSLDRLDDSFFVDPRAVPSLLDGPHPPLLSFGSDAIDQIRERLNVGSRRPAPDLPVPTCHWLEGGARSQTEQMAAQIDDMLRPVVLDIPQGHLDLALDGRWAELSYLVLLEDSRALAVHLRAMSHLMSALDKSTLEEAHVLARACANYATALESAIRGSAEASSEIDRAINIFSRVRKRPA